MNEERMRILTMIEKGTITAEEGAKLLNAVEEKNANNKSKSSKKKYGFKEFVGEAVDKIKNVDFDLSFGESAEFDHHFETEVDFHDIDASIANGSLAIEPWQEAHARAEYKVKVYQVEEAEEAKEKFLADHQFEAKNNLLRIASPSKKVKAFVKLYLPQKNYEFIKVKLSNGSITSTTIDAEHFHLKTANGSIQLKGAQGEVSKLSTGNGSITVSDSKFETCETETVNGSMTLNGHFGKNDASTISGAISVVNSGSHAHTGFFKTVKGNIAVTLPPHKRIDGKLKSSVGSLNCELDNYKILNNKKEVMNKELQFEAHEEYEAAYHLEAETKTGSVTIRNPRL
ncbi:DUF4097 family beta strand repeat-containing protein [Halobacillus amylolyticus]|uniref:DUF4097 family beta strand repeat-containing protein n=1 Tax=Halobacillus amylolyticus TaxID=2932259 RepID=A0ABY4HA22_9BACI|nr:DUF4097 family beta strand repeat-containing protein [Halobacillus amylolyticus]UOR11706.1 DUF4097 family beta strand repeat-containing protein [Halobacillus amylolyticus]